EEGRLSGVVATVSPALHFLHQMPNQCLVQIPRNQHQSIPLPGFLVRRSQSLRVNGTIISLIAIESPTPSSSCSPVLWNFLSKLPHVSDAPSYSHGVSGCSSFRQPPAIHYCQPAVWPGQKSGAREGGTSNGGVRRTQC
ncbi:hypothetical protein GOODEAATRI_012634, partial [Goodea atripinnis]